jgi:predicted DsbA family dithiol-disulfide isomerase
MCAFAYLARAPSTRLPGAVDACQSCNMAFRQTPDAVVGRVHEDSEAVEVVLHHDVLCAWSYLADARLAYLRDEYGGSVRWRYRGYTLRPEQELPDRKERAVLARHFRRVAKEREGQGVVPDLWTGRDPPTSSLPPLIALEAALPEGVEAQRELLVALRDAAFLRGINVTRRDVILEMAGQAGLNLQRFISRFDDPRTAAEVNDGVEEAEALGIRGAPALVIGDEWLMQGCRDLSEYRQVIDKYLLERASAPQLRMIH